MNTPELYQQLGTGIAGIVIFAVTILWLIALIILPFVVYSMRQEVARQTRIMQSTLDQLRAVNQNTRP
jgi:uncharacterized membrane protein